MRLLCMLGVLGSTPGRRTISFAAHICVVQVALNRYCRVKGGVNASQLGLPSLAPLSAAGSGLFPLGVAA